MRAMGRGPRGAQGLAHLAWVTDSFVTLKEAMALTLGEHMCVRACGCPAHNHT